MDDYRFGNPGFYRHGNFDLPKRRGADSLPAFASLLMFLTATLAFLTLPLLISGSPFSAPIAWVVCILSAGVLLFSVRKASGAMIAGLILIFFVSFTGSPQLPALILGSVLAIASGTALICEGKGARLLFPALIPLLSYALSYAITGDLLISCLALTLALPMWILGLGCRFKMKRTNVIVLCTAMTVILFTALGAVGIYSLYGELSRACISALTDSIGEAFLKYTEQTITEVMKTEVTQPLRREIISVFNTYVNMFPGLLVASVLIAVYAAQSVACQLLSSFGLDRCLNDRMLKLSVSVEAAVLFLVAHVLSFTTTSSGGISFVAVVANNVSIMLMPALLMMGIETIRFLPLRFGIIGFFASAILLVMMFALSSSFPIILALVGTFFIIVRRIDAWAKEFYGKGDRNE